MERELGQWQGGLNWCLIHGAKLYLHPTFPVFFVRLAELVLKLITGEWKEMRSFEQQSGQVCPSRYKAVMSELLCQCWSTCLDKWNRAEEQTQGYVNSDIPQRQLQSSSEGIHSSVKMVARLDNHMGKTFPRLLLYHTQINSRFIKNLHLKNKTQKPF